MEKILSYIHDLIMDYKKQNIEIISLNIGKIEYQYLKNQMAIYKLETIKENETIFGFPFIVENEWGIFISGKMKF